MAIDILTTDHVFPDTVYILAPGWEGRNEYGRIPGDAFVITVNKGFQIPDVQKHLWIAEDLNLLPLQPWFADTVREVIAQQNDLMAPETTPVFDGGKMYDIFPDLAYIYRSGPHLSYPAPHYHPYAIIPGLLRGYCSISSKAIQLAVQKGAKRVILCGVDMWGKMYFNEEVTESGRIRPGGSGEWPFVARFNELLKWLKGEGIEVVSLSPTALNLEVI